MNTKILALGLLSLAFGTSGCRNTGKHTSPQLQSIGLAVPKAARITIDKLDFTGICGNGTDCIYFMQENGKFYIDFEAMSKEQLPYLDSLKQFAKEHGYPIVETTYNNTPLDYDHLQYAPVLSLKVNTNIDSIVKVGKQIEYAIFRNNDRTVYEIVP